MTAASTCFQLLYLVSSNYSYYNFFCQLQFLAGRVILLDMALTTTLSELHLSSDWFLVPSRWVETISLRARTFFILNHHLPLARRSLSLFLCQGLTINCNNAWWDASYNAKYHRYQTYFLIIFLLTDQIVSISIMHANVILRKKEGWSVFATVALARVFNK